MEETYRLPPTRPPGLNLNFCVVKRSRTHGRGVFATSNIEAGELITMYPADIINVFPDENAEVDGHKVGIVMSDEVTEISPGAPASINHTLSAYRFDINKKYSIIGHPMLSSDPNYMGHMINDASMPRFCGGEVANGQSIDSIHEDNYFARSIAKANVKFEVIEESMVVIVALRAIKKGEELYVTYGVKYWRSAMKTRSA